MVLGCSCLNNEDARPDKQPRKKHTKEQGSNKENVC